MRTILGGVTILAVTLSPLAVLAQDSGPKLAAPPASKDAANEPPPGVSSAKEDAAEPAQSEPLAGVVRGLYVEARVGGGYMLLSDTLSAAQVGEVFPERVGDKEGLGVGSTMHVAVGYDLTPQFALQALAGLILVSGTYSDRVRDLGITFAGVGGRLAVDLSDRLDFLASLGAGFAKADNGVEAPDNGAMIMGGVGLEYYVHIRHFSVGLELAAYAPLSPTRAFAAVSPTLKYTF